MLLSKWQNQGQSRTLGLPQRYLQQSKHTNRIGDGHTAEVSNVTWFQGCPFRVVLSYRKLWWVHVLHSYSDIKLFLCTKESLSDNLLYGFTPWNRELPEKKKSKAKQNKKTEKRKRKERNLSKQRTQRVLLKTIPNENEMKNKYKTKLKNVHYLTPTVFWLTILTYENFQLTTFDTHTKSWGYSGLKQTSISDADTLGFVMWTCLAEGSLLVCAEQEIQALFYPCSSSAFT